jgi:hypothetical protein
MNTTYKTIESELEKLEEIDNWNDKVKCMQELQEQIKSEKDKLNDLMEMVINDDFKDTKKKKNNLDLDSLIESFNESENINEKVKIYQDIHKQISDIEKQLFNK